METAEGSVPGDRSAARLSYLLFAASLAAYYFVPLVGALSLSYLNGRAFSSLARRSLVEPTLFLFLTPFIVGALAWGLGARAGLRPGFAALCRTLTRFLIAQALFISALSLWGPRFNGKLVVGVLVVGTLSGVAWTALRTAHDLRTAFGLSTPRVLLGMGALAFAAFEFLLAVAGWRLALLNKVESVNSDEKIVVSWPLPPAAPLDPRDDAGPGYRRVKALFKPLEWKQSRRLDEALRGDWKDPAGEWSALLAQNRDALKEYRDAARRPRCEFSDPRKTEELWGEPSFSGTHLLGLARLTLLDAKRAEAQGHDSAAADDYAAVLGTMRHFVQQRRGKDVIMYYIDAAFLFRHAWPPLSRFLEKDRGSADDDAKLLDALRKVEADRLPLGEDVIDSERRWFEAQGKVLEATTSLLRPGRRDDARRQYAAETQRALKAFTAGALGDPVEFTRYLDDLEVRGRWAFPPWSPGCRSFPSRFGDCWAYRIALYNSNFFMNVVSERLVAAQIRVLATAAAIRVREKTGHLAPVLLAALAPEIPRPLEDPFSGAPLRYLGDARGHWTVYSVGPDRKDDGAQSVFAAEYVEQWRAPAPGDIVLRGSP